jgi:hypothetical protein
MLRLNPVFPKHQHCRTSTVSARSQWALPDLGQTPERTSDRVPERMSKSCRCQIDCQKKCQNYICQKVCQIGCQSICHKECLCVCKNKYAIYTAKWYVRNYVRIVFQGGPVHPRLIGQSCKSTWEVRWSQIPTHMTQTISDFCISPALDNLFVDFVYSL